MIELKTILKIAIRAIQANKMRSVLTSLGIIIGVAAVIILLSIGNGTQKSIENEMRSMGTNLIMIRSGSSTSGGARMGRGSQPTLKNGDADAIQEKIPAIRLAVPVVNDSGQIIYGSTNWSTSIVGTDNRFGTPEIRAGVLAVAVGVDHQLARAAGGVDVVSDNFHRVSGNRHRDHAAQHQNCQKQCRHSFDHTSSSPLFTKTGNDKV